MQQVLPIGRDPPGWPRHRLIHGVVLGRREARALEELVGGVAPEPIFTRLEASDDGVTRRACVSGRMLTGRVVTTSNVSALGTPSEMKPPPAGRKALHAPCPAGWYVRSDGGVAHNRSRHESVFTWTTVIAQCCDANSD
jgi:hypothetical protein